MLGHKAAFGGTLMVAARLISRIIDLSTMLILARLLSPSDFGLVAIAMTVVLILEAALELPLSQALVRLPEIKPSYYDTAFTLGLLRGGLLCLSICLIARPFAAFYHHVELVPLIQVLSIAPASRGLFNPRMAQFAKDLNFKYEFIFELVSKTAAFIIGTAAAWVFHSYWSIALCTVTAPIVATLQSYYLAPFRPKLTLADWRVFVNFLGWISLSQILMAIGWQSDQLLLGKLMRPSQLGLFSAANNITIIPLTALFVPIQRPLLSAFAAVTNDPMRLRSSYQDAANAVVTIGLPLLVGQSLLAGPMVHLLLGSKWDNAIPMTYWLSLSLIPALFGILVTPVAMALNKTQQMVWQNLLFIVVKLPCVVVGAIMFGFMGVIAARLISETANAVYCMIIVRWLTGASVTSQLLAPRRSVISALVMAGVLTECAPWLNFGSGPSMALVQLIATAIIGAAVYGGFLLTLWRLEGKPPGIETITLRMAGQILKRVRRAPIESNMV